MKNNILGNQIKILREKNGLNQSQLAQSLSITQVISLKKQTTKKMRALLMKFKNKLEYAAFIFACLSVISFLSLFFVVGIGLLVYKQSMINIALNVTTTIPIIIGVVSGIISVIFIKIVD